MSLSCGFATDSSVPQKATGAGGVPAPHEFSASRRADRAAGRQSRRGAAVRNRKVAALLMGLIAALRLRLPFASEAFWVLLALSRETR